MCLRKEKSCRRRGSAGSRRERKRGRQFLFFCCEPRFRRKNHFQRENALAAKQRKIKMPMVHSKAGVFAMARTAWPNLMASQARKAKRAPRARKLMTRMRQRE